MRQNKTIGTIRAGNQTFGVHSISFQSSKPTMVKELVELDKLKTLSKAVASIDLQFSIKEIPYYLNIFHYSFGMHKYMLSCVVCFNKECSCFNKDNVAISHR